MTPEERAQYLVRGPYVRPLLDNYDLDDLEELVTKAIRQAIQEEREAIIAEMVEYSEGIKEVLPRDAMVVMERAQAIKERK